MEALARGGEMQRCGVVRMERQLQIRAQPPALSFLRRLPCGQLRLLPALHPHVFSSNPRRSSSHIGECSLLGLVLLLRLRSQPSRTFPRSSSSWPGPLVCNSWHLAHLRLNSCWNDEFHNLHKKYERKESRTRCLHPRLDYQVM
ncbi:uncharacterized protein LOC125515903 isoform X3 [Triticum urartu]|uniref:uncharacterized protein LOC125515903 isoform X3 n=1 Tax=Triticum urartu TaxID=4572 RepID=UPI002042FDC8|nr:uncharacterized protein LOC125515903 isoform X3 [Triticum urartu]